MHRFATRNAVSSAVDLSGNPERGKEPGDFGRDVSEIEHDSPPPSDDAYCNPYARSGEARVVTEMVREGKVQEREDLILRNQTLEIILLELVAERTASHAQPTRGTGDVPAGSAKDFADVSPLV